MGWPQWVLIVWMAARPLYYITLNHTKLDEAVLQSGASARLIQGIAILWLVWVGGFFTS